MEEVVGGTNEEEEEEVVVELLTAVGWVEEKCLEDVIVICRLSCFSFLLPTKPLIRCFVGFLFVWVFQQRTRLQNRKKKKKEKKKRGR
jgi:hypothetical protein